MKSVKSRFIECKDVPDDSLWTGGDKEVLGVGGDKEVLGDFHLFTGGETS